MDRIVIPLRSTTNQIRWIVRHAAKKTVRFDQGYSGVNIVEVLRRFVGTPYFPRLAEAACVHSSVDAAELRWIAQNCLLNAAVLNEIVTSGKAGDETLAMLEGLGIQSVRTHVLVTRIRRSKDPMQRKRLLDHLRSIDAPAAESLTE